MGVSLSEGTFSILDVLVLMKRSSNQGFKLLSLYTTFWLNISAEIPRIEMVSHVVEG